MFHDIFIGAISGAVSYLIFSYLFKPRIKNIESDPEKYDAIIEKLDEISNALYYKIEADPGEDDIYISVGQEIHFLRKEIKTLSANLSKTK